MKRNPFIFPASILLTAVAMMVFSCSMPAAYSPESTITIRITGSTDNPVNIAWQIHDSSGTESKAVTSDITYSETVPYDDFDTVYTTITNTGNIVKASSSDTTFLSQTGFVKEITLDDTPLTEHPENGLIKKGDVLVDTGAASPLYFKIEYVDYDSNSPDIRLFIYDEQNDFTAGPATGGGAWSVYKHNDADLQVSVYRDGQLMENCPVTFSTLFEDINLSCGSLYW